MSGYDINSQSLGKSMTGRKIRIMAAVAAGVILLLWLFCLPAQLFDDVSYSTVVTAKDGELLGARVADDGQWRFPTCDSLPEKFRAAIIEYEDRSFYSHWGISIRGIARAFWQNISNGRIVSGGSTISMQTIRLSRRGRRTIAEKLIEMFMATRLEWRYSKDEILRLYVSHAPFGGNVVGFDAAVWRYLGNNGKDMSWAEAATLAVMQNAPSSVHLSKNRDRLLAKRNRLLKRLYEKGALTTDEYELAVDEPLIGEPYAMPQIAPHLVEWLNKTRHGRSTHTDIDYHLQKRIETLLTQWRDELSLSGVNDLAAIITEVSTGKTVAYCGNADIESDRSGRWVDIAAAPRSSGSILKPLLYCAAMQDGIILEHTILPDIPTDFGGFVPKNFDGNFCGVIGASQALALSLNVPYVWLLKEFGVSRFALLLQRCGFGTLTRSADRYGLSLILGGAEVYLRDVVACYADLARFRSDYPLNDSVAIYAMFDAMREVNRPDQLDLSRVSSAQNIAWKTGTSYGARDGWAVGVTPGYVVGVWAGNADGSGVAGLTGARTPGPVMFDIFNLLPSCGWFAEPHGHEELVCEHSGRLAGKYCSETRRSRVAANALKSRRCTYCTQIPVSSDGMRRVADAKEPMVMKSFFLLPPVHKYFYKQYHADYIEPPADTNDNESNLRFIYPSDGSVISLPNTPDSHPSALVCKAAHANAGAELFWHLDNNFVRSTTDIHQIEITLSAGSHKLTVYDNTGLMKSIEIIIR